MKHNTKNSKQNIKSTTTHEANIKDIVMVKTKTSEETGLSLRAFFRSVSSCLMPVFKPDMVFDKESDDTVW